jgi:hypothetical protein
MALPTRKYVPREARPSGTQVMTTTCYNHEFGSCTSGSSGGAQFLEDGWQRRRLALSAEAACTQCRD